MDFETLTGFQFWRLTSPWKLRLGLGMAGFMVLFQLLG